MDPVNEIKPASEAPQGPGGDEITAQASGDGAASANNEEVSEVVDEPQRDPRYPLTVLYCPICSLPPELHSFHSNSQFEKCKEWLRKNSPQCFPDLFPEECAQRLEALRIASESGGPVLAPADEEEDKIAKPIEQKTSGGKKKKTPAEVVLALGQRKGKKQVTIVFGLDLFSIKLKEAAKVAKKKFATGCSVSMSADNREVIEIQGSRQDDMAALVHKHWGVPQEHIYLVNAQKKKVKAFS